MENDNSNLELLRRFEPILHFTRGERFYPMATTPYVNVCSLWTRCKNDADECLIAPGELSLERLSQSLPDERPASTYYLKLTDPASAAEIVVRELRKISAPEKEESKFQPSKGRLARVGYISRFIDALFSMSLLLRGRVRGDTAAAAESIYRHFMQPHPVFSYHGRVYHQDGWVILQYWFFYAFNNWRSGFSGANDHEADWESIHIYLYPSDDGQFQPEWVAYASHYEEGDDTRRHWDDPELQKIGNHPVVYVAAGSHASYFTAGEYLPEVELQFLSLPARIIERLLNIWHQTLRQYRMEKAGEYDGGPLKFFRVPFVDYARGDGLSLGPGQAIPWDECVMLNPVPGWIRNYRGLWGLDAHDAFGGENAPGGPMYTQNGSVRRIWRDPVGWAGLDKITPPNLSLDRAFESAFQIRERISQLKEQIQDSHHRLELLGIERMAMHQRPYLEEMTLSHQQKIDVLSEELDQLGAELTQNQSLLNALENYIQSLESGRKPAMRMHLKHPRQPVTQENLRLGKIGEFWAAASVSIMLIGIVAFYFFARHSMIIGLAAFLMLFLFLEASVRGWLTDLIATFASLLALATTVVLLYEFFWPVITTLVFISGAYILWENLRELWS